MLKLSIRKAENGFTLKISKGFFSLSKTYIAKDQNELQELIGTAIGKWMK